jgi:hypothetical protein
LLDNARQCLNTAQTKMDFAAPDGVAVLPGDRTGRWIPEYSMAGYQNEIDTTRQEIEQANPVLFDPARTAQLLCPRDATRRQAVQAELEKNRK